MPDNRHPGIEEYLRRIEYDGELRPSLDVLRGLQLAHTTHIPFENLDILLGRPILLDLGSLEAKLVRSQRGGYCFEQNLLLAAILRAIGFSFLPLAARVRVQTDRTLPRTHMALLVEADGAQWLVDAGFGADGLLLPVAFEHGAVTRHFAWSYRMLEEGARWVLQMQRNGAWQDQYAFTLEPQELVDYELANYYTSTHPDSRFTRTLTAQLPSPHSRAALRDRELTLDDGSTITTTSVPEDELLAVLADRFGLHFPAETKFNTSGRD